MYTSSTPPPPGVHISPGVTPIPGFHYDARHREVNPKLLSQKKSSIKQVIENY